MIPISPSRLLRTALILWAAVFFCLVVLPGTQAAEGTSAPYCPLCSLGDAGSGTPPPADAPIGCAICHLKSNLELPPAWIPPPTLVADLAYLLPPLGAQTRVTLAAPARLRGRGPPAA